MTLRISLRDGEKVIVNGAVLRSVGRTNLCVENNATLLRGRDVMNPEDAKTPASRLYFSCMLAYIDPANGARHQDAIVRTVAELMEVFVSADARATCIAFAEKAAAGQFYRALADCRWLMRYEAEVLARHAEPVEA